MGQAFNKPPSNPFLNSSFLANFKRGAQSPPPCEQNPPPRPSIFATLRRPPVPKPNDFIPLFNDCVVAASSRTQEYLLFKDPEDKFRASPEVLTQVSSPHPKSTRTQGAKEPLITPVTTDRSS